MLLSPVEALRLDSFFSLEGEPRGFTFEAELVEGVDMKGLLGREVELFLPPPLCEEDRVAFDFGLGVVIVVETEVLLALPGGDFVADTPSPSVSNAVARTLSPLFVPLPLLAGLCLGGDEADTCTVEGCNVVGEADEMLGDKSFAFTFRAPVSEMCAFFADSAAAVVVLVETCGGLGLSLLFFKLARNSSALKQAASN